MNGSSYILFDPQTACLTEQAMFAYIDGKLTPGQCHQVEKHLLDCAFCSEALEGLELVKDRNRMSTAFIPPAGNTNGKDEQQGGRIVRFNFSTRLAAAAVIVLLIGCFVLFRYLGSDKTSNDVAQSTVKKNLLPQPEDSQGAAPVTSDDQTFSKHFEPFPAPKPGNPAFKTEDKKTEQEHFTPNYNVNTEAGPAGAPTVSDLPVRPAEKAPAAKEDNSALAQTSTGTQATSPPPPLSPPATTVYETTVPDKTEDASPKQAPAGGNGNTQSWTRQADKDKSAQERENYRSVAQSSKTAAPAKRKEKTGEELALNEKKVSGDQKAEGESKNGKLIELNKTVAPSAADYSMQQTEQDKSRKVVTVMSDSVKATNNSFSNAGTASPAPSNSVYTLRLDDVAKKQAVISPMDEAMEAYRNNNYTLAADKFGKILAKQPDNLDALFYEGVSLLGLPQPDTKHAISDFDKVLGAGDNSFTEAAKWYKALALIKENNATQALPLLDEMSKGNGTYRAKATKVMKDLGTPKK